MKKAIAYFLTLLIMLLFSSVFLISCKSKQPPLQEVFSEKTVNHDSISLVKEITKTKEINDSLKMIIGQIKTEKKECDSVCQIAIDRLLSQLNTKKTSGDNVADVWYDPKDKSLNINTKVGETKSENTHFYYKVTNAKTIYSHRDIPVEKPLSKFELFLMISGIVGLLIVALKTILFIRSKVSV